MKKYDNIFVLGATSDIGESLVQYLRKQNSNSKIYGSYHSDEKLSSLREVTQGMVRVDVTNEESWRDLDRYLYDINVEFDLIISCVGTLDQYFKKPEKSLKDVNLEQLHKTFSINSFQSVMMAKSFKKFIPNTKDSKMIFLSAMVGSIGENEIGGWYSYRASKTALNMFVKNISIEYSRLKLPIKVYAVHPGTTETNLSKGHLKGVNHKIHQPKETAENIVKIIEEVEFETGSFFNWDGRRIEW